MAVSKRGNVDLYIPNLTFCYHYCRNGRGRDRFPHFLYKINPIYRFAMVTILADYSVKWQI